jgi:hypothetical protein
MNLSLVREEVTGGWRILHNEELHNFSFSLHIIRVIIKNKAGYVVQEGDEIT